MIESTDININTSPESMVSPALEKRGILNEGGFLTPYYLFDLMERRHGDELDPIGREAYHMPLRRTFQQAQKIITGLVGTSISFERTWTLWYKELFETLGFASLRKLDERVETMRYGQVPINYAYYLNENIEEEPLIFVDLHPFGTDLDHARYSNPERNHELTTEPISRALEFALDHNQTRWALLSNGLEMRLYRRGGSVARQYLKVDFVTLFARDDPKDWLVFWGLFRLAAFLPVVTEETTDTDGTARCLLDKVIDESQRHATKIADDLRENIVRAVESLLQGVIETPANQCFWEGTLGGKKVPNETQLKTLFEETVYFLYRLLFVLYAESRDLLPIGESEIYKEMYSLDHLRTMAEKQLMPVDYEKTYYIDTLRTLFGMLYRGYPFRNPAASREKGPSRAKGSTAFRIPPYNGRLFSPERTKLLDQCEIPDRAMREVVRELSLSHPKRRSDRAERYSYADLGVDQLGSVYEGLLVYEPSIAEETMVEARLKADLRLIPQDQADELELPYDEATRKPAGSFLLRIWGGRRKGSGSYYTPQEITGFLVKDALAPLVDPIIAGCAQRNEDGKPVHTADEILNIKICDPAMGSGHFLVQACRYLGDAYGRAIIAEEQRENTRVSASELAKYKRRVAEKCLYGVDLNPLAVELAKVSLWLETLAQDRPLTFLDAHLRCGNSLIGAPLRNAEGKLDPSRLSILPNEAFGKAAKEDTKEVKEALKKLIANNKKQISSLQKGNLTQLTFINGDVEQQILADYEKRRIELEESDEDKSLEDAVALVHRKHDLLQEALIGDESQIRRFKEVCDLWCSVWFWPADASVPPPTTLTYHDLIGSILQLPGLRAATNVDDYLTISHTLAQEEIRFFHWELEYPEVWFDDEGNPLAQGGFDVIVGNPPWESILLNSKEFWSNYLPTFRALGKQEALRAAKEIRAEPEIDFRWRKYIKQINQQSNILKLGNFYSWQGSGYLNTYKLFLEQMISLTKIDGIFSIVTPSGIYTDEGCTDLRRLLFYREEIRFLLSLENKKGIFPIHSSFKVVLLSGKKLLRLTHESNQHWMYNDKTVQCLFLIGKNATGYDLAPSQSQLGLFLPQLERTLLHIPVPTINKLAPSTLSLMEFKTQQDVDLIIKIYSSAPLLGDKLDNGWNVTIRREFHMTGDSHLFHQVSRGWPLWEGKGLYQFNSDYGKPRYWIDEKSGVAELCRRAEIEDYYSSDDWIANQPKLECDNFRLAYREVTSSTNEVTLIAAILPPHIFVGHTINAFTQWTYLPEPHYAWTKHFDESNKLFLLSLLNSFVINFLIRQKVTSHVSTYLINQLPIPRLSANHPVSQLLVPLTARLICTDERFSPLWEALAINYPHAMTSEWDETCAAIDLSERALLRTHIDTIIADLHNIDEFDFAYILNTFPLLDRDQPPLPGEERSFITRDLALLTLFTQRGKIPPSDIIAFFSEAGVDIRQRTGPIVDLAERVRIATQELGAIAYQPSQRNKEESNGDEEMPEQDELDFYDEE
jgi:N-6 DNA Methylase